jgi:hypothetical protein
MSGQACIYLPSENHISPPLPQNISPSRENTSTFTLAHPNGLIFFLFCIYLTLSSILLTSFLFLPLFFQISPLFHFPLFNSHYFPEMTLAILPGDSLFSTLPTQCIRMTVFCLKIIISNRVFATEIHTVIGKVIACRGRM